jgi:hypothetical protein
MLPKVISIKEDKKDGEKTIIRTVKDEILGIIKSVLIIKHEEIVLRTWSAWGYREKRLRKVKLRQPYKGVDTVLAYDYGFEGGGFNNWRGVDIVPRDPSHVDMLLSKIVDFDTFANVLECLRNTCRKISTHNIVECDISACL